MSYIDSIISRMGLDITSVQKGMLTAQRTVDAGGKRMEQSMLKSSDSVSRNLTNMSKTLLNGSSAADALAGSVTALGNSLRLGLGAGAAVGIGVAIFSKIQAVRSEATQLKKDFDAALAPKQATEYSSMDEIQKRLEATRQKAKELNEELSNKGKAAEFFDVNIYHKRNLLGALRKSEQEGLDSVAEKQRKILDIEEMRVNVSEKAADLAKIEAEFKEKRGAINSDMGQRGNLGDRTGELAQLQREEAMMLEQIERKDEARKRALRDASLLDSVQHEGKDVSVRSAKLKLASEREAPAYSIEEREAQQLRIKAAERELAEAERIASIRQEQNAAALEIASLAGSADEKREASLKRQLKMLERVLSLSKEDEKTAVRLQIAAVKEAQAAEERAAYDKAYAVQEMNIDLEGGKDYESRRKALWKKKGMAKDRVDRIQGDPAHDPRELAAAKVHLKDLEETYSDLVKSKEDAVKYAKAETEIMLAHISGEDTLAGKLKTRLQYEEQIAAAQAAGNLELANQLTHQKNLSLYQQGFNQFNKTPERRQQEKAEAKETERQERAYNAQRRDVADQMARGVTDFGKGARGEIAEDLRSEFAGKSPEEIKQALAAENAIPNAEDIKREATGDGVSPASGDNGKLEQDIANNTKEIASNTKNLGANR